MVNYQSYIIWLSSIYSVIIPLQLTLLTTPYTLAFLDSIISWISSYFTDLFSTSSVVFLFSYWSCSVSRSEGSLLYLFTHDFGDHTQFHGDDSQTWISSSDLSPELQSHITDCLHKSVLTYLAASQIQYIQTWIFHKAQSYIIIVFLISVDGSSIFSVAQP